MSKPHGAPEIWYRRIQGTDAKYLANYDSVFRKPATPSSGFFIVSLFDKPCERLIAQRRADGKFYYVHPSLRDEKQYHGMTPSAPTPIEAFGLRVALIGGRLYCAPDPSLDVTAVYGDGRPRKWQGLKSFKFHFKNETSPSVGATE